MSVDEMIAIDNWIMKDFDPKSLRILEEVEDEPNFQNILEKAKARYEAGGGDAKLIGDLLKIIQHLDNTLDSYFWNMGDHDQLPHDA